MTKEKLIQLLVIILNRVERDGVVVERVVGDDCEGVHGCLHYKLAADHSLAIQERK